MLKRLTSSAMARLGLKAVPLNSPASRFHSDHYLRHTARRLEHLASLQIPVSGNTVLEVGAGIGDHTDYYLDRECKVTITEARDENLAYLRQRFPDSEIRFLDMDNPADLDDGPRDIVHCYGLLYHLSKPERAIEYMARHCRHLLLLETCVSFGDEMQENLTGEDARNPTQALTGTGCRPTRNWLHAQLGKYFEYVYIPRTQPNHEEFPLDWSGTPEPGGLTRAIFVASRSGLDNEQLSGELLMQQTRHP